MTSALNPALGFVAGALTILSPCVLPLVPIVLGSAAQRGKWGPAVLAAGLVASFTATGFALATLGTGAGLDGQALRLFAAVMLALIGMTLLIPAAQHAFERAAAPLAGWAGERQAALDRFGLWGQAGIGVLLGLVWSPCVGPTLGAATLLAAQGENLAQVAFVMLAFGSGIASVLLAMALGGRTAMRRWNARLLSAGNGGRRVLGALLLATGVMIGLGIDKWIEAIAVANSPDWLIALTTSI